ncbi:MAG: hypothetical protein QOI95_3107 [Acidimicrobiaceae bacterium]
MTVDKEPTNDTSSGRDFPLPGCGATFAAVLLFGIPGSVLFLAVSLGAAYGSRSPLLFVYSGLLVAGVALVAIGIATNRLVRCALAFFIASFAVFLTVLVA